MHIVPTISTHEILENNVFLSLFWIICTSTCKGPMVIVNDPIIQRQRYWTSSSSTFRSRMIYTLLLYLFPVILRIMIKKKLKKPITHMSSEFLYKVPFWLRWKWPFQKATFNLSPNVFKGFWRCKNQKSARATENEIFLLFGLFGFFFFHLFRIFYDTWRKAKQAETTKTKVNDGMCEKTEPAL